jgi:maltooligosyltrehalose trehalohydrolase
MVRPAAEGGWGLDAVWADDFHHQLRRLVAGDADGYYEDFAGTMADLAATIRHGWFYRGQWSSHLARPRGSATEGVPPCRMIVCVQNHDQIGNRPFGRRLHQQIDLAVYRAISALLMFVPETPLLFMGQEWAASTRFLFFTDHNDELGRLVTEGRREEFSRFRAFADPRLRMEIPDPQAASTFESSRLQWDERERPGHAGVLALYRELLALRRAVPALRDCERCEAFAPSASSLVVRRAGARGTWLLVLAINAEEIDISPWLSAQDDDAWETVLSTDDTRFASEPDDSRSAAAVNPTNARRVRFPRPGAVLLRTR